MYNGEYFRCFEYLCKILFQFWHSVLHFCMLLVNFWIEMIFFLHIQLFILKMLYNFSEAEFLQMSIWRCTLVSRQFIWNKSLISLHLRGSVTNFASNFSRFTVTYFTTATIVSILINYVHIIFDFFPNNRFYDNE